MQRTSQGGRLLAEVERELKHRRKLEAAERHEARYTVCLAALRADPGFLTDQPHPDAWRTDKTLRDQVVWLLRTRAEHAKAFKIVETVLVQRAAKPDAPKRAKKRR